MTTTDYAQLQAVRELLTRIPLSLDVDPEETGLPREGHGGAREAASATIDTASARALIASMARQLDDYILPRSASMDSPLTIVVGGSTGAGKSTLVNTLLGEPLTQSGAIRPTTRHPVLLYRAEDEAALTPDRFLPTLPRTRVQKGEGLPGADPLVPQALVPVPTAALPRGIALIDAPDIDSVSEENRTLAKELLSAADLWLFVTTANRYADAVPWELLHAAAARSIAIAVVLNRVPEGDEEAIETDLRRMLREAGIEAVLIHTVTEQPRDDRGLINPISLAPLTLWIRELGADAPARAAIARTTLAGTVETLARNLRTLALEQEGQQASHRALAQVASEEYEKALAGIDAALSDGSALRGQPAAAQKVEDALESGIYAVVVDAASRASEGTRARWRSTRAGRSLLHRLDAAPAPTAGATPEEEFSAAVAAEIRLWQASVLDMIREEGAGKRQRARFLSLSVNAVAVLMMVAAFSLTGGLTGVEVGIAGGSGVVGAKLLESIFGEDAVRRMATRARTDLLERMGALLREHGRPFTELLAETEPEVPAETVWDAARSVQSLAEAMTAESA